MSTATPSGVVGVIHVVVEAVEQAAALVSRSAAEARRVVAQLERIETDRPTTVNVQTWGSPGIAGDVEAAIRVLRVEAQSLADLADDLATVGDRYTWVEEASQRAIVLLHSAASARNEVSAAALLVMLEGHPWLFAAIARLRNDPFSFLTIPAVVAVAREGVEHADDAVRGLLGIPPWLSAILDDDATGWFGQEEVALMMVMIAGAAGLKDGAVVVRRVSGAQYPRSTAPPAPATVEGHIRKIEDGAAAEGRITVDEVELDDGSTRWNVYIGGTSGDPGQPYDAISNVSLKAGLDAGSLRAARQAMAAAGVSAGDDVAFIGYSQGGMVASQLAASGEWNTAGVLTVGSPGTDIEVPGRAPHLALEHTEDIITALNGRPDQPRQGGPVIVTESALDGRLGDGPLGGHHLVDYIETAADTDSHRDARIATERDRLLAATAGTLVASTVFAAERVSPPAPAPAPAPAGQIPRPVPVSADVPRAASGGHR